MLTAEQITSIIRYQAGIRKPPNRIDTEWTRRYLSKYELLQVMTYLTVMNDKMKELEQRAARLGGSHGQEKDDEKAE